MRILREKRLNHELRNGVSLDQLKDKLWNEYNMLIDNDRLLQAIGCKKDLDIVQEWINIDNLNK